MTRQVQIAFLAGLLLLLSYVAYRSIWSADAAPAVSSVAVKFVPLPVENPALRLDLLDALKKVEYEGPRRNIFDIAPPPAPVRAANTPPPAPALTVPPPPPPLVVPATFFGYVADVQTGTKRALFSEGDEVYVLGVGEVLAGRFRLLQIGNSTAELEETSSGRRTTLTMEEPNGS